MDDRHITKTFFSYSLTLLIWRDKLLLKNSGLLGLIALHEVNYIQHFPRPC